MEEILKQITDALGTAAIGGTAVIIGLIVCAVALVYVLIDYIFTSVGLCSMARHRGVRGAWMAWFPILNVWLLGSVADQYMYVVKGKECKKRKTLLGLTIWILVLSMVESALSSALGIMEQTVSPDHQGYLIVLAALALLSLAMLVLSIVLCVNQYIVLYRIYYSATPDSGAALLVVSIFFPIIVPYVVFALRKKENGMPPRRADS